MLATLKFQVTVCTAHAFLVRFLKAGHADKWVLPPPCTPAPHTIDVVDH